MQLLCPDFIAMPLIFYIIVSAAQLDLWDLRHAGWIFDMGTGKQKAWYEFYSYYGTHDYSVFKCWYGVDLWGRFRGCEL